jgi:hypothetical protein
MPELKICARLGMVNLNQLLPEQSPMDGGTLIHLHSLHFEAGCVYDEHRYYFPGIL